MLDQHSTGHAPNPHLWAKTGHLGEREYHPLLLHLLDVACCAEAILEREPAATRERMGQVLGLSWEDARPWILLLIAAHDLGKAWAGFQACASTARSILEPLGLRFPPGLKNCFVHHGFVSQVALEALLREQGWPDDLADLAADAVGCHHGTRVDASTLDGLRNDRRKVQEPTWVKARQALFDALLNYFKPQVIPSKHTFSGPDFMLLSGLTSFADWIGSDENRFTFGAAEDFADIPAWWESRRTIAQASLDAIGWTSRTPLLTSPRSFQDLFTFKPRPLQEKMVEALALMESPGVILVEAPMGEGKTEAAFYAHLELQRRFGHRGLYIGLPTKATGNAMFGRTLKFLKNFSPARNLDLQLLHGATALNEAFQSLKHGSIHAIEGEGQVRVGEWFTHRKRALLSEYGVGTVDQALLPVLPVRHNFVRLWGLANRVVVFDEIHAYDAYTGTLLVHLIHWLVELGSSVVLLSATLPPGIRRKLAGALGHYMPEKEADYPRLTLIQRQGIHQLPFKADPSRRQEIHLQPLSEELSAIKSALDEKLPADGCALALLNTVQRAQDLYRLFPEGEPLMRGPHQVGKRLRDGTEILLFHARCPAYDRQSREDHALACFGKEGLRNGRRILIATQVAEQSLDLDFDLMVTDLAPIDLLLQRAGRLWRHERDLRPISRPCLLIAGLEGAEPPDFGAPLWWGAVYREDLLLLTWVLLKEKTVLDLPEEIDGLVQTVYEEQVRVPTCLQKRLFAAVQSSEGKKAAYTTKAYHNIIGNPNDASWQEVFYEKADEDEPGLHPSLCAATRMSDRVSITIVPIFSEEAFEPDRVPSPEQAKTWSLRSINISRVSIAKPCQAKGIPPGWRRSSLLRSSFPLILDEQQHWVEDKSVFLDEALGLCIAGTL